MSHYFETPTGAEKRRTIHARIWDTELEFTTAAGVFSATRLDLGTSVLFDHSAPPPRTATRLADVGCGFGPIAVSLALAAPWATVDAVDVNERALALTSENARALGVGDRVRTLLPGEVPPDARYDEIWSNPPIRIGKDALHELLLTWLPRLADDGQFRMVVGRNLGADSLQRWIAEQGWACTRVGSSKGFRVLVARPQTEG